MLKAWTLLKLETTGSDFIQLLMFCRNVCNAPARCSLLEIACAVNNFMGSRASRSLPEIKCLKHSSCSNFNYSIFGNVANTDSMVLFTFSVVISKLHPTNLRFADWPGSNSSGEIYLNGRKPEELKGDENQAGLSQESRISLACSQYFRSMAVAEKQVV